MILKAAPLRRDTVKDEILKMISSSAMKAGDRLLSEKKLGEMLKVNHLTVRAALAELADQGIVERVSGSGTFFTGRLSKNARGTGGGKMEPVGIMFRTDEHFFSGLHNEILLALRAENFMGVSVGSRMEEDEIMEDLVRLFSIEADSILVSQTEIEKTARLCDYFNLHASNYRRVIRLLGNQSCELPLLGHQVTIDYADAYRTAIARLSALGHKKIAYIGGLCDTDYLFHKANRKFIALYTEAMMEAGLTEHITIVAKTDQDELRKTIQDLLAHPEHPTAMLCMTDSRGALVIDVAREMKVRIPDDLSVIGFYNTPWSTHYNMATFKTRDTEIAARIAELFRQKQVEQGLSLIKADLVERATIAPAPQTI